MGKDSAEVAPALRCDLMRLARPESANLKESRKTTGPNVISMYFSVLLAKTLKAMFESRF